MEWREDDISIENGAIFTFAESYAFVTAFIKCTPEVQGGLSLLVVFISIEHGDGLADDLGLGIAFDLLGALVPAHHAAFGVDQEDGVILYMPHEDAKVLFE